MDAAGEARALGGVLALARVRRAALEIHDPIRLFTAARTPAQLRAFATGASQDAARAVELLDGTGLLAGNAATELAQQAATMLHPEQPGDVRIAATRLTSIADEALSTALPANESLRAVVERRFGELLHEPAPLDKAAREELSLLGLQAGLGTRHGLVTSIVRDVHGDVGHVLRNSSDDIVRRVQDAWATQLAQPADASIAEARELIAREGITPANARRLLTVAVDLRASTQLRLPTTLPWVGTAEDVLTRVGSGTPLDGAGELARWRMERLWQRTVAGTVPEREALRAELLGAATTPVADPAQSRELLHLVEDLRGGQLFAGLSSGAQPTEEIRAALTAHAAGSGDVAAAEFARGRLLARLDGDVAEHVAGEARDALRTPSGDSAPAVQLMRAEPQLRQHIASADRLGVLGATTPRGFGEVAPWLDEVDASMAARGSEIPGPLREDIDRLRVRIRGFLDGTPPDDMPVGYGHHPDYAEVGRLGEQLRLADTLTGRAVEAPAPALADSLPW